jgi:hypothetical protein
MKYQFPKLCLLAVFAAATLTFSIAPVLGQQAVQQPFTGEIKPTDLSSEMLRRWDFGLNPDLGRSRTASTPKLIRIIYLVPSDRVLRNDYRTGIANSILHIQGFYENQLSGARFTIHDPIVESHTLSHPAEYYRSTLSGPGSPQHIWFWENVLNEALPLVGGGFNDPNNRWVFYIDADLLCGQVIGGTSGVAVMAKNDFRGLVGEQNVPACAAEQPDNGGYFRWVGGAAHELGHSFSLPHPPGCGGPGGCTGGSTAANSLMWVGYAFYPNTYFLPSDKVTLLNSGFFATATSVSISGRVTRGDGRGVAGARVTLTNASSSRYAVTNHFGYYRFVGVPGGATYTILTRHKSHVFNAREVTANGDLTNIDIGAQ